MDGGLSVLSVFPSVHLYEFYSIALF